MPDRIYEKNSVIANRYMVQQLLGAGNFSYVYKVLDTLTSEVVALKVFKETSDVLDRLREEFHILQKLTHTHVARVYDIGQLPDHAYFLKLEYIEGSTLANLIQDGLISLTKARQLVTELLEAIAYLHSKKVMHRDIKPNNLITNGRGLVIIDFNISKLVESYAATRVGTPRYMPPEVNVAGWNWTGDLYAVGIVLYEMLTRHYPFDDAHPPLFTDARDPREYNALLRESLVQLLLKSLAKEPQDRYQTAEEMLAAVNTADWKPGLQPHHIPSSELDRLQVPAEEMARPDYNPYLRRLLTLYSQSRYSNAGTRGLDDLAQATYVPTLLDTKLKHSILSAEFALIIITGNAGDGKTAFIQKLEGEIETNSNTTIFERLESGNGCCFVYNGTQFLTNYDGSQDEGAVNNDTVLRQFFEPFAGAEPLQSSGRVHIIAINEGRLLDFFHTFHAEFPHLFQQVHNMFERDLPVEDDRLLIVNLNFRAVVADNEDGVSIFDQMINRLTAPALWQKCVSCAFREQCYVKFNVDSLNDLNYGAQIRERLKVLFQIAHFRQRLHLTIRDMRSALAYLLFGVDDCEGIQAMLLNPDQKRAYQSRYYYNALFDNPLAETASHDRLVKLLAEIDPGEVANPKLDAYLAFTPPDEISKLALFDTRSTYDVRLLREWYDLQQQSLQQGRGDSATVLSSLNSLRAYHVALRRKVYFEKIEKDWATMLPYQRLFEFRDVMKTQSPSVLEQVRNRLIYAISLSESIYHPEIGQEYLCLRTSQESRVTVKSFRRFHHQHFWCRVQDIGKSASYVEYLPMVLMLNYEPVEGLSMDINLDLYEMLHHIYQGYTPSLNELRGSYINLLIFKRQLASTQYDEVLLTEDEQTFYRVRKTPDHKLIMTDALHEA